MHGEPTRAWTVGALAKEAALSRSTFFERFRREVGVAPMEYLLGWRMAMAKDMLRGDGVSVGEVAQRVGYSSSEHVQRRVRAPSGHFAEDLCSRVSAGPVRLSIPACSCSERRVTSDLRQGAFGGGSLAWASRIKVALVAEADPPPLFRDAKTVSIKRLSCTARPKPATRFGPCRIASRRAV